MSLDSSRFVIVFPALGDGTSMPEPGSMGKAALTPTTISNNA